MVDHNAGKCRATRSLRPWRIKFYAAFELDGRPLDGDGEVFTGRSPLEVVLAMKGATLFSDHRDCEDYIDMVLRNAKMLAGGLRPTPGNMPKAF